jgi:hypothetical protein
MYKIASQEIDFHDRAAFLETLSKSQEIPNFVKKAAAVERDSIPLEKFALVIVDSSGTLPKLALHNKAYTWISSRLFGNSVDKIPERGAQIAATHIKQACEAWGIDTPDDVSRHADPVEPVTGNIYEMPKNAACESVLDYNKYRVGHRGEVPKEVLREKLDEFLNFGEEHPVDPQQLGEELASKVYAWAMQTGYSLPGAGSVASIAMSKIPNSVENKGKVRGFLVDKMDSLEEHEKVKRASQIMKEAGKGTMGIGGNFPMHTPELVKKAEDYFFDHYDRLAPRYRKELATNIVKNASEHGLFVESDMIRKYAGQIFSRALQGNVMARKSILMEKNASKVLDQLYSTKDILGSEKFAEALEQFDKQAGISQYWGSHIKDPYPSTFEVTKVAQWTCRIGQDVITEDQLRRFVSKHAGTLRGYVNDHIVRDLKLMPVEIFDSLPMPEKEIILAKMEEAGVA